MSEFFEPNFPANPSDDRDWTEFVDDLANIVNYILNQELGGSTPAYTYDPGAGLGELDYSINPIAAELAYCQELWLVMKNLPRELRQSLVQDLYALKGNYIDDVADEIVEILSRYWRLAWEYRET